MCDLPLRQQATEAIHDRCCDETSNHDADAIARSYAPCILAADAVVALLNLTEERGQRYSEEGSASGDVVLPGVDLNFPGGYVVHRYCTPWLPSTPPDTSRSEPA